MTNQSQKRTAGSIEDFERNWVQALEKPPYFAYPRWETDNQWDLFEEVKIRKLQEVLNKYKLKNGQCLEYGCGPAGISIWLANNHFTTYALDISLAGLKLAEQNRQQHLEASALPLSFVAGNAMQLPFADDSFDFVISNGLLEHFDEPSLRKLLPEILRVLKPGGLFFADIVHGRFSMRTVGNFVNFSSSFGFHLVKRDFKKLPHLWASYFDELYENKLDSNDWQNLLNDLGLKNTEIVVNRPFPPLAVQGSLETFYVRIMRKLWPVWRTFDNSQNWLTRRLGWVYLVWGTKGY